MIIYLAGPWARRDDVKQARQHLRDAGFTVNSRWLDFVATPGDEYTHDTLRQEAMNDVQDIQAADALVVLNLEVSEGKATEQGMAYMLGTPVVAVGPSRNVFQHLDGFTRVDTLDDAIAHLKNDPAWSPYR